MGDLIDAEEHRMHSRGLGSVRMLSVLAAVIMLSSVTLARVWTTVYRCDERTPLEALDPNQPTVYRDIMVGTHLVIVVSSDTEGEEWRGTLHTSIEGAQYGVLNGRGLTLSPENYAESCLSAAGRYAQVVRLFGDVNVGFSLTTTSESITPGEMPVPGDWFIFDYYAEQHGFCNVVLRQSGRIIAVDPDTGEAVTEPPITLETLSFTHVPSRDFDDDVVVDFNDFALLLSRWQYTVDPNEDSLDLKLDLDGDRRIDVNDLVLFSDYWLERTDCASVFTLPDPNDPPEMP